MSSENKKRVAFYEFLNTIKILNPYRIALKDYDSSVKAFIFYHTEWIDLKREVREEKEKKAQVKAVKKIEKEEKREINLDSDVTEDMGLFMVLKDNQVYDFHKIISIIDHGDILEITANFSAHSKFKHVFIRKRTIRSMSSDLRKELLKIKKKSDIQDDGRYV